MALEDRLEIYKEIERVRGRPLVVYVTSSRQPQIASGRIAGDVISELLAQLQSLPEGTDALDLLLVSQGGDPTVAWRVVSLIRETVGQFAVLVPQAAFSAATLIALGADEIVMHPHGNLGPVDPQIVGQPQEPGKDGSQVSKQFGSEDLAAFLEFCRRDVGLSDQSELLEAFKLFCKEVGAIGVGVAARSAQLSVSMGEKLLRLHMREESQAQEARAIAEALNKQFFHHGYPVSRSEAREIGLKVPETTAPLEELLWRVWLDMEGELQIREPFNPHGLVADNSGCAPLFEDVQQISAPNGIPPQMVQQFFNQVLQQVKVVGVPSTPFSLTCAVVESTRLASRFIQNGRIFASRLPDLQIHVNLVIEKACWHTMEALGTKTDESSEAEEVQ